MSRVYRNQKIEGIDIGGIIENGSYFYTELSVYEDGIIGCWEKCDLQQFQETLRSGWVVPQIPLGEELSIFGIGDFKILDARWLHDKDSYYDYIVSLVRQMNPEMQNIYRTTQREMDRWEKYRVSFTATSTPFKFDHPTIGYDLLDGEQCNLFYKKEEAIYLTFLTVYEDKTIQIAAAGEEFFSPDQVDAMFAEGILLTCPEEGQWVKLAGLGEICLAEPEYEPVTVEEKQKEVAEMIKKAAGESDAHERCQKAYHQYLINPNDYNREALRNAYEAVPEHERMYLGDMDSKDWDFRRILHHPERKREV